MPVCKNCKQPLVMDARYENGWAHETPVPDHDADICHPILTAEPEEPTSVTIDFDADELLAISSAMRVTGDTLNQFISRAIKNTAERYERL